MATDSSTTTDKLAPVHPGEIPMEDFIEGFGITQGRDGRTQGLPRQHSAAANGMSADSLRGRVALIAGMNRLVVVSGRQWRSVRACAGDRQPRRRWQCSESGRLRCYHR